MRHTYTSFFVFLQMPKNLLFACSVRMLLADRILCDKALSHPAAGQDTQSYSHAPKGSRSMITALLPKGAPFFELLLQQNALLCEAATKLTGIFEGHLDADQHRREISSLENQADRIYLSIHRHLSQTFITPIDREDIQHINKVQEAAIDLVHNLSNRFYVLELTRVRFPMVQLMRCIQSMVLLTRSMLEGLAQKRDSHNTREFRSLSDECEMLLSMGIRELYDLDKLDLPVILDLLKWTRAYDRIEAVVNQVVLLAETIEETVLKNV